MTIIVFISRMVYRMIPRSHYWETLSVYIIVDIGRPDTRHKQQQLMGKEMEGDEEERDGVGEGLHDAVKGVEGETGKRGKRVLLVVLVVNVVKQTVTKRNLMKETVHPIDAKFHKQHINCKINKIHGQTYLRNSSI
eukprot:TRINITY_DN12393_c0_g1_i7.p5 TRINITY_DN12393_c0_g1~~TRINITY_DN12393_c0_g1_i7.p5  ORF type:complete len:136 (+),score=16.51 TRINITY_DN12393_c0_g1_i7:959-1366(+)